jgi:isopenicillin-N epimerase
MTPPPEPLPGARLLFSIDPGVAYLNHGGFGAAPLPVQHAQQRLRDEMESNPHLFFTSDLMARVEHARRHLAAFLGADPDSSAFVANATAGVNVILGSVPIGAGDEIVTTSYGYGAVDLAVDRLCDRVGAKRRIAEIELFATDDQIVDAVTAAITGRTRLLLVDHITSPTARVMPVERLVAAARERSVPIAIDGAHAPGALPVDVSAIGSDFWVGNLHKWLYSPRPAAILHVASEWRKSIAPSVVSWEQIAGFPGNLEMQGTLDYTSWLAAPTGLYVMQTLGTDAVRGHNAALVAYGQSVVGDALGLLSASDLPDPGHPLASMRVVPLPDGVAADHESADELRSRIFEELRAVVAINPYRRCGLLRLSAQVYNRAEEFERLAAGLPRLLKTMR